MEKKRTLSKSGIFDENSLEPEEREPPKKKQRISNCNENIDSSLIDITNLTINESNKKQKKNNTNNKNKQNKKVKSPKKLKHAWLLDGQLEIMDHKLDHSDHFYKYHVRRVNKHSKQRRASMRGERLWLKHFDLAYLDTYKQYCQENHLNFDAQEEGQKFYEISEIHNHDYDSDDNNYWFRVSWQGYSRQKDTWEPTQNLFDTDEYKQYCNEYDIHKRGSSVDLESFEEMTIVCDKFDTLLTDTSDNDDENDENGNNHGCTCDCGCQELIREENEKIEINNKYLTFDLNQLKEIFNQNVKYIPIWRKCNGFDGCNKWRVSIEFDRMNNNNINNNIENKYIEIKNKQWKCSLNMDNDYCECNKNQEINEQIVKRFENNNDIGTDIRNKLTLQTKWIVQHSKENNDNNINIGDCSVLTTLNDLINNYHSTELDFINIKEWFSLIKQNSDLRTLKYAMKQLIKYGNYQENQLIPIKKEFLNKNGIKNVNDSILNCILDKINIYKNIIQDWINIEEIKTCWDIRAIKNQLKIENNNKNKNNNEDDNKILTCKQCNRGWNVLNLYETGIIGSEYIYKVRRNCIKDKEDWFCSLCIGNTYQKINTLINGNNNINNNDNNNNNNNNDDIVSSNHEITHLYLKMIENGIITDNERKKFIFYYYDELTEQWQTGKIDKIIKNNDINNIMIQVSNNNNNKNPILNVSEMYELLFCWVYCDESKEDDFISNQDNFEIVTNLDSSNTKLRIFGKNTIEYCDNSMKIEISRNRDNIHSIDSVSIDKIRHSKEFFEFFIEYFKIKRADIYRRVSEEMTEIVNKRNILNLDDISNDEENQYSDEIITSDDHSDSEDPLEEEDDSDIYIASDNNDNIDINIDINDENNGYPSDKSDEITIDNNNINNNNNNDDLINIKIKSPLRNDNINNNNNNNNYDIDDDDHSIQQNNNNNTNSGQEGLEEYIRSNPYYYVIKGGHLTFIYNNKEIIIKVISCDYHRQTADIEIINNKNDNKILTEIPFNQLIYKEPKNDDSVILLFGPNKGKIGKCVGIDAGEAVVVLSTQEQENDVTILKAYSVVSTDI